MKLAIILPSLANKGPIIYCKYLVEGLINRVEYIEIFYFNNIVEVEMPVKTTQINFFEKFDFSKFDIIHTHNAVPDLYAYKNINQYQWVSTMHDMYKEQLFLTHNRYRAWLIIILWTMALKKVRKIVVFSSVLKEYYSQRLSDKEIFIIPTGVPEKLPESISIKDEIFLKKLKSNFTIIGGSGLLTKRKGFKQLIKFLASNITFALVITGDGEDKESLLNYAKQLKVDKRFILLGFKDNAIDYYQYYDIYVLPSYAEGLPLSLLEAMSQSLPIVCSNLKIYNDYFLENDVSFFELDDQKSLENAIQNTLEKKEIYKRKAYRIFKDNFSITAMADKYINLYKKIESDNKKT
jgi:L-malate glycosyltransferase